MSQEQASPVTSLIPMMAIFAIFYFLLLKPQKDKQKQLKQLMSNLKKNDQIITTGGIHGTIVNIKQTTVIVRIDADAKMEIDIESIASVVKSNV